MSESLPDVHENRRWKKPLSVVLSGSLVMLFGSVLVSGVNFVFNVSMARMLGPAVFSHTTAIVTLFMLCSAITLSFQMVCAKFVARNSSSGGKTAVARSLMKRAWITGIVLGVGTAIFNKPVAAYLHLPAGNLLLVFAIGLAFYVPLGVKRGNLQGLCKFPQLTWNFVLEAASKLVVALLLVHIGYGAMGAVGALSASVFIALLMPIRTPSAKSEPQHVQPASFREGMQAGIFFIGQVVINNIDILLVKHYFSAEAAGVYAAVALVGRVLYFVSWSMVSAMFPVSAAAKADERNLQVLIVPLLGVMLICVAFLLTMGMFPGLVINLVFGESFRMAEPLLLLYAVATGLYALSAVLMAYEMSRKIANTSWLQLVFSGVLVVAIALFHADLREVIVVQIVLMSFLLFLVSLPFFSTFRAGARLPEAA